MPYQIILLLPRWGVNTIANPPGQRPGLVDLPPLGYLLVNEERLTLNDERGRLKVEGGLDVESGYEF